MFPVLSRRTGWGQPIDLIDREFGRMMRSLWGDGGETAELTAAYPMDVWEDDDHVYVEAELPGFRKDDIDVTLEQGMLQIAANRTVEPRAGALVNERRHSRYQRAFTLPCPVDESKVQARFEDGILHLTLPKRAEVKPRRITVS